MSVVRDLITGVDGQTADVGRIGLIISILGYFAMAVHEVWHGRALNFQDFGIGLAAIVGSFGALLKLKENTEPHNASGS
jgi:hypothetical protein